ncbi:MULTISPECIES: hypothetical protein [unclassified Streptomyces]|uniref:hypothetical protein n=1 Tax=unclassified Streptomyces TaxID=2593676 RepID=UPI002E821BBD|nr:hypothetical protein [Streptomyces sp. NBC_00569]WSE13475.1 hypothetical protein OG518_09230 [Streptomyces sp. NBC_01397]WUB97591.1 hypothetical protein OHO83_37665 [Streptomyces sp. NBC_00569]
MTSSNTFLPFLKEHGLFVATSDDLAVYEDAERLAAAVRAGTGLTGRHGGIAATRSDRTRFPGAGFCS